MTVGKVTEEMIVAVGILFSLQLWNQGGAIDGVVVGFFVPVASRMVA